MENNLIEPLKILVLGVGGNVSQGIIKTLKKIENIVIIGACVSEYSVGMLMCERSYLSPFANEDHFIKWLITLCNLEKIDLVMTGVEENIIAIAKNINMFQEGTKAKFVSSDYKQLLIGQNKYLTCEWLKKNHCNYPKYALHNDENQIKNLMNQCGFPLIAKPILGKGSQGVYVIHSKEDLEKIIIKDNYILQEYIGTSESEYTVGCYCDSTGQLINCIIMQRFLQNGTTMKAVVVENKIIRAEVEKICRNFKPIGPFNIQLRLDQKGKPVTFEFNVRFSGTTPMRAHFGFNDVVAMINEYCYNQKIESLFNIQKGIAYRYMEEVYIESSTEEKKSIQLNL